MDGHQFTKPRSVAAAGGVISSTDAKAVYLDAFDSVHVWVNRIVRYAVSLFAHGRIEMRLT